MSHRAEVETDRAPKTASLGWTCNAEGRGLVGLLPQDLNVLVSRVYVPGLCPDDMDSRAPACLTLQYPTLRLHVEKQGEIKWP